MALTRETYRALEDVVGTENISEDDAVLDGYAFQYRAESVPGGGKFLERTGAVLLPGSTEEVQAIVRACNRYKLKFRAHSTGWGYFSSATGEDTIQLDMRRMNRILEIDEKNMLAVVEPYISHGQLHVEAIKKGLRPHVVGVGPSSSLLANSVLGGQGPTASSTSHAGRNVLGWEWVLPTGEILRLGSAGSGAGWFTADGPGPSLRGILRGYSGPGSAFGVITKLATKLYPWPGPPEHRMKGRSPMYEPEIPELLSLHLANFPSPEARAEAEYLINEAEIAYSLQRLPAGWLGPAMTKSNEDFWKLWQTKTG